MESYKHGPWHYHSYQPRDHWTYSLDCSDCCLAIRPNSELSLPNRWTTALDADYKFRVDDLDVSAQLKTPPKTTEWYDSSLQRWDHEESLLNAQDMIIGDQNFTGNNQPTGVRKNLSDNLFKSDFNGWAYNMTADASLCQEYGYLTTYSGFSGSPTNVLRQADSTNECQYSTSDATQCCVSEINEVCQRAIPVQQRQSILRQNDSNVTLETSDASSDRVGVSVSTTSQKQKAQTANFSTQPATTPAVPLSTFSHDQSGTTQNSCLYPVVKSEDVDRAWMSCRRRLFTDTECDQKTTTRMDYDWPTNDKTAPHWCNVCEQVGLAPCSVTTQCHHQNVPTGQTTSSAQPYSSQRWVTEPSYQAHHRRPHGGGARPFVCPVNSCRRRFSLNSSLVAHVRTHSGLRPHVCGQCGRAFGDRSTLTKHVRVHSGARPYRCDQCSSAFSQSGNLARHRRLHSRS